MASPKNEEQDEMSLCNFATCHCVCVCVGGLTIVIKQEKAAKDIQIEKQEVNYL